jgi:hypothetical protein
MLAVQKVGGERERERERVWLVWRERESAGDSRASHGAKEFELKKNEKSRLRND